MDLTADTGLLATAATDVARGTASALTDPVSSGLLLTARGDSVVLAGTDRERWISLSCTALVHTDGAVLVPARPLAETLRALPVEQVRLSVEGNRLAVRTPSARFALPLLDIALHPGVPEPPARAGVLSGAPFAKLCQVMASVSTKDDSLPVFTGVRLRAEGERLGLVATDRYRLGIASLPWRAASVDLDVLVPAQVLADAARKLSTVDEVAVHADGERVAVCWPGVAVGTALLAVPFINEQRYASFPAAATAEFAAAELAGAVHRVGLYADDRGAVRLELADGELRVRGEGQAGGSLGEAEESVKATVDGQLAQAYRVRFLLDALRVFGTRRVRMDVQEGLQATAIVPADSGQDSDGVALRYVVMPIRAQ